MLKQTGIILFLIEMYNLSQTLTSKQVISPHCQVKFASNGSGEVEAGGHICPLRELRLKKTALRNL